MADENMEESELKRMKDLEKQIIREIEERAKLEKMEAQAKEEMNTDKAPAISPGSAERRLLLFAAVIIVISMPLLYPAEGIFLAIFTIVIAIVAGLTSARRTPLFNLFLSVGGVLLFQLDGIYEFQSHSHSALFIADEVLSLIFLFSTYYSVKTYRIHHAIDEERKGFRSRAAKNKLHKE